jgi:hypothetical protein
MNIYNRVFEKIEKKLEFKQTRRPKSNTSGFGTFKNQTKKKVWSSDLWKDRQHHRRTQRRDKYLKWECNH